MKSSGQKPSRDLRPSTFFIDETPEPTSRVSGLPVVGRLLGLLGIGSSGRADAHRMAHQARRSGYKPRTAVTGSKPAAFVGSASNPTLSQDDRAIEPHARLALTAPPAIAPSAPAAVASAAATSAVTAPEPPATIIKARTASVSRKGAHQRKATARRPRLSLSGMSFGRMLSGLIERFSPKEPRRREMAVLLGLVLAACLTSVASLAIGPAGASGNQAANIVIDPTDEPTPEPTMDVSTEPPTETASTESASPAPTTTPSPTPRKTKKPKKTATPYRGKINTFVAIGDSLTAWPSRYNWPRWLDVDDVRSKCANNAGIPGNVTSQMLARFSRDVLSYKPDFVLIMGGTNDISPRYNVPMSTTMANLKAMVKAAKSHKSASGQPIKVFLMSIPPQRSYGSVAKVRQLNAAIYKLAWSQGIYYVDDYTPLAGAGGVIKSAYVVDDGLHLSYAGASAVGAAAWRRVRRVSL